jgi:hypothetical protein
MLRSPVYIIEKSDFYQRPSHCLQDDIGDILHMWNPPPMHLPVSWESNSTHEQNELGIATPVQ